METNSPGSESTSGPAAHFGDRRKSCRFDMHFSALVRAMGDPWALSETADVSAAGALFVSERPLLFNTPVEYVLTFPTELTKAALPLRVRFFGMVLRCEQTHKGTGGFGIAVRNTAHRYLTREEAIGFDALEQKLSPASRQAGKSGPPRKGVRSALR